MGDIVHGFVVIFVSSLLITGNVKTECSKFGSVSTLQKATTIQGRCTYGFLNNAPFTEAKSLCSSEGTQLITLQSSEKQALVWEAMGSQFGQHWMGLEKVDGVWYWLERESYADVTSTRWESESTQSTMVVSYTMSSNDRFLWKMAEKSYRYSTVCEDVQEANPVSSSTVSPPTFGTNFECLFQRLSELTDVATFKQQTSINTKCAMQCLIHPECQYFRHLFNKPSDNCILMKAQPGSGNTFACNQEICYKRC